jgi:hypothetical protein
MIPPTAATHRHTVEVGEDAADPDVGGQLVLGDPHPAAGQLLRRLDARCRVHVDPVVPEGAGREDRDGDERGVLLEGEHEGGQRELGDVELLEADHPEEGLLRGQGQHRQIDTLDGDAAVRERAGAVVVAACERDRESCHRCHLGREVPLPSCAYQ